MNIKLRTFIFTVIILILNIKVVFAGAPKIYYQNEINYPPYRFVQDGRFEGFETELSDMIFKNEDYHVIYSYDSWDKVYGRLKKGEIDTCGLLAVLEERKNDLIYTDPVLQTSISLYTRKDDAFVNMNNLKDFRVAVVEGQFAESVLKNRIGTDNYVAYGTIDGAISALVQRKVDALFENQEVVDYILIQKGLRGIITPMETNQFPVDFAYGVSKERPELVGYINNRMAELQDTGVYEELFQKYFYTHSQYYNDVQKRTWIRVIVIVLVSIAAGAVAIYIYVKYLKKRILKINKELYERHEQLNVTLSSICDGVLSTDKNGCVEYMNKTATELLGYKDSEVLGRHIDEVLIITDEGSKKRREAPLVKAMDKRCQIWIEGNIFLTTKEGSELSVEASVSPIINDDTVIGSVFVFHDITERKVSGDIIRQERNFSNNIVDHANIFILLINSKSELIKFNEYAQQITGFNEAEVIGNKWIDVLIPKEHINMFHEIMGMFFMGNVPPVHEFPLACKDGKIIHGLWNNSIIFDKDGNPDTMISMGLDITERKTAQEKLAQSFQELEAIHEELAATEEELRSQYNEIEKSQKALSNSEERYRLALEGAADGLWDYDIQENKVFYSARCREMLGYQENEIENDFQAMTTLVHPDDREKYLENIYEHLSGKTPYLSYEYRLKTKTEDYKWVLNRGKAIWDKEGKPVRMAGSLTDITKRKISEETIHMMAYYDSITGLPNRMMFLKMLSDSIKSAGGNAKRVCLFFLDLDNFKSINDTLGHKFGDQILKLIAQKLQGSLRDGDAAGRLAGDEFVLLIRDIDSIDDIKASADKVLQLFQHPITLQGHELYITASMGIAVYPDDGIDEETLIRNADVAMYCSKEWGKNNYQLYNMEMNTKIVRRLKLENSLRYAIKHGEFTVYYQPLVDITTGELVGMEALVRWFRSGSECIPPLDFIPLAEETGLILPIGEFVLKTACAQNKAWQDAGYPSFRISVNLSARQFQQHNLPEVIADILRETGLNPKWLSIEITESIAMQDLNLAVKMIGKLKEIGIEVSLDDFGTGYSSLNYLKKLPIDVLKIDKSFVHDISEECDELKIIKAVIMLAHSMDLKVVAEGVETHEQLRFLKGHSCDRAQGYLFSKPLPPAELENLLKNSTLL